MKKETINRLAAGLTRELAADLAIDTHLNGLRLVRGARIVADAGDFAGSFSLAMTAREESAKMMLAVSFLLGATRPHRLVEICWNHAEKQAAGLTCSHVADGLLRSGQLEGLTTRATTIDEAIGEFVLAVAEHIAPVQIETLNLDIPALERGFNAALCGADEQARQDSLYVSLTERDGALEVVSPCVTEEQCRELINDVEAFLSLPRRADLDRHDPETTTENRSPVSRADYKAFLLRALSPSMLADLEVHGVPPNVGDSEALAGAPNVSGRESVS